MAYFCNYVVTGQQPQIGSLDFALDIMKVYEAGLRSQGDRVSIA